MKLYELSETYQRLLDAEDLTDEERQTYLDNIKEPFNEKVLNIGDHPAHDSTPR